ncbi:hypothetical protein pipiens_006698 [Culex pipiens pipiens]|uniref:Uncharacterized protein n=1 Tax=Culex pipiens pipiens TaxID=38569 RepID=A0ABD1DPJ0_CULPP
MEEYKHQKTKHEELRRRIRDVTGSLNNRTSQLQVLKKRCEEVKLHLTDAMADDKTIAAFHELERSRYAKLRQAVEEHKAAVTLEQKQTSVVKAVEISPSYVRCSRECELDEKERHLADQRRKLAKREQAIVIRKNHNAARIVRLRKLLQSNEEKRALYKEQLAALRSKASRRY